MLPKTNRLQKNEFSLVLQKGMIIQTPLFGVAYLKKDNDLPKFGFIVSKKISKKSPERNRIKRLLREVTRKSLGKISNGFLFVILAKRRAVGAKYEEIQKELNGALVKTGALK